MKYGEFYDWVAPFEPVSWQSFATATAIVFAVAVAYVVVRRR